MDDAQTNHLKAYGLTFWVLEQGGKAEWLLNYRGGSFLLPEADAHRARGEHPRRLDHRRLGLGRGRDPRRDRGQQHGGR